MRLTGIARIQLVVREYTECVEFYTELVKFFGGTLVFHVPSLMYWVIGSMVLVISRSDETQTVAHTQQGQPGLHHLCYRVRSLDDVHDAHDLVRRLGAKVLYEPSHWPWAPGYYAMTCEDPDGNRIEISFIPWRGHLDESVTIRLPIPS